MPGEPAHVIIGASLAGAKAAETLREEGSPGTSCCSAQGGWSRLTSGRRCPRGTCWARRTSRRSTFTTSTGTRGHHVDLQVGVTAGCHRPRRQAGRAGQRRLDRLRPAAADHGRPPGGWGLARRRSRWGALPAHRGRFGGAGHRPGRATWGGDPGGDPGRGLDWPGGCRRGPGERLRGDRAGAGATALHRQLGPELGDFFADLRRGHGVDFRFGETATGLHDGHDGRVTGVVTSGGADLPADVVVVAIGAAPSVGLAEAAGLEKWPKRGAGQRGAADQRPGRVRGR